MLEVERAGYSVFEVFYCNILITGEDISNISMYDYLREPSDWLVPLLLFRRTEDRLVTKSLSSVSSASWPDEKWPLSLFLLFPRLNSERLPAGSSEALWPVRGRKSCCEARCELPGLPMVGNMAIAGLPMAGDMAVKDEAVEVAVLLRERRLNTELRFPECERSRCSGEGISPYEDASEH